MSFIHLHTHSHYSLLDGLGQIPDLVRAAKKDNATALALTDHGVMYGALAFYKACKKEGIKPIIGVEAYMAQHGLANKNSAQDRERRHITLLAKNNIGYQNLLKLTTIAHLEGFYYKPRIDWETLLRHKEGVIVLSGCLNGEIATYLRTHEVEDAVVLVEKYLREFGEDFYLEAWRHTHLPEAMRISEKLTELAKHTGVPLVATQDAHYLRPEDNEAQDVLVCIQTKKKKKDTDRLCMLDEDYSLTSAEAMAHLWRDVPEAITNTKKVADTCTVDLVLGETVLPHFTVPSGETEYSHLENLCAQGVATRFADASSDELTRIQDRLFYELGIIRKTGFASYFLIVADFVNWAKAHQIVVGPGRGSAAGSLVAYLLNITNINPLQYDLLFERFLNPERISMPDIDLDFADTRRDEVLRYVENKYGKDHVAQVITFGTMAARVAVRDVGRVLDMSYGFCDRIAKLIPLFKTLDEALGAEPELRALYDTDHDAKILIDTAKKLEGVVRHTSTHACAVVITPKPLVTYTPLQYASSSDATVVTQYEMHAIEDLGLLKMDFLGLKNLSILEEALRIVKRTRGVALSIDNLPLDDDATYTLLKKGDTTGVFQLESSGMKRYLKELKPTAFEDIVAMVALYRPGPMDLIPDFILGKHGKKKATYLHPKLEPILSPTYGVAVYQEQLMQIARDLAGFTLGEADVLRKAVGKKIASLLAKQKEKFIAGCVAQGVALEVAQKVFEFVEPFARYGFNKSHAACYGLIAYQTAYVKANYPAEFMAALLTADQGNTDRIAIEVEECRRMGLEILPPDIRESYKGFTVVVEDGIEPTNIRFGLAAIKNVGEHVIEAIIEERAKNGAFTSLEDFLERVKSRDLNKKSLESFVKAGALDSYGDRGTLLANLETIIQCIRDIKEERASGQESLFGKNHALRKLQFAEVTAVPEEEFLRWEKELLGMYVSAHPYAGMQKDLEGSITPIREVLEQKKFRKKDRVTVGGIVHTAKRIITRTGEPMLFVTLEDGRDSIEVVVFPRVLAQTQRLWEDGAPIVIVGERSRKDAECKLIAERVFAYDPQAVAELRRELGSIDFMQPTADGTREIQDDPSAGYPAAGAGTDTARGGIILTLREMPDAAQQDALHTYQLSHPGSHPLTMVIHQGFDASRKLETHASCNLTTSFTHDMRVIFGNSFIHIDVPSESMVL
ncbi:MAG: DNA polymerase III subunit alpha [Parcubacteria group bacterium CG11_big_fil_rev_8_21_14_0_20_48_46]|nr:MAG: DNA polymerase III subunit alpha [Parcubacteria group bacterium CG11_big_fil_rev_8_21_14_0_20_48_46]